MNLNAQRIARKFARVTPQRTEDYAEGVANPKRDWGQATAAAEDNYKAGVQKAASEGRFGRGVKKAGTAKWQAGVQAKGKTRWGEGVALAEDNYAKGMEPVVSTIERTQLPPRYPKGDPRNIQRAAAMAKALHDMKTGGK